MAKSKKLTFEDGEQLAIKGAMFQVLKLKNGNMTVRAIGGYDMEGSKMVLRQPMLEKSTFSRKLSEEIEPEE
jgi:hypothetical protein